MKEFGLYDALEDMVVVIDSEGMIVYENQAWIGYGEDRGRPPDESLVGDSYMDHIDTTRGTEVWTKISDLIDGDRDTFSYEFPCHGPVEKDWYKVRGSSVNVDDDQYFVLQYKNISPEKILRQELDQLRTFLTSHEGYIDHEMKNKATVILGHAEMLEEELGTINPEYIDDYIRPIKLAVNEVIEVIDSNSASAPVFRSTEKKEIDMDDLIQRVWAKVMNKDIEVEWNISQNIYADEIQLRHFIESIIFTATEANPDKIKICELETGDGFYIKNNGSTFVGGLEGIGKFSPDEEIPVQLINRIATNHDWVIEFEQETNTITVRDVDWFCEVV